jgi:hypothetical protein
MLGLNVKSNFDQMTRGLTAAALAQVAFAKAQALNAVGKMVMQAEQQNIRSTLKNPKPFTQNSLGIKRATKSNPVVVIFMKDLTAKYLKPYETGGVHELPGKALLNPKDIKLDQYGQLPKTVMAKLRARPDIFIGPVKTKAGIVNGVWQRYTNVKRVSLLNSKGKRLRGLNKAVTDDKPGGQLKLLIRFGDALPVKKSLKYGMTAKSIVDTNLAKEFDKALTQAIATAR